MNSWKQMSNMQRLELIARMYRYPFGFAVGLAFVVKNAGTLESFTAWIFVIFGLIWIVAGGFIDWRGIANMIMTDEEQKAALKFQKEVWIEIIISVIALVLMANISLATNWFNLSVVWRILIGVVLSGVVVLLLMRALSVRMRQKAIVK